MLLLGVLYLGQYQNRLIETKLKNFESTAALMADTIAIGAVDNTNYLLRTRATEIVKQLNHPGDYTIRIFNAAGSQIVDGSLYSKTPPQNPQKPELSSIKILKDTAAFFIDFMPESRPLPLYPQNDTPDVTSALQGNISLSAWQDEEGEIILSAAAPVISNDNVTGAVLIIRNADDIESDIADVWTNILKIFVFTLLITTALSIYLSGVIASPLRKLAKAAEKIRTGRFQESDIPDFSTRHDEIGELSIAFRTMMQALWQRMDSIESFAADVSHELKNPLTSLRSAIETLERVKSQDDKDRLMHIIHHDIARMDRLITDISNASRLDAEISREAFDRVDLKPVLENLVDYYTQMLKRENNANAINFVYDNHMNYAVMGNEPRLEQLFRNLIDNALSFSPQGSTITLALEKQNASVIVTLSDKGPGIPEDKQTSIFERFYSQRPEDEDYGTHSGLGLSICKQISDAHGAEIFAENMHDESGTVIGARFSIIFKTA